MAKGGEKGKAKAKAELKNLITLRAGALQLRWEAVAGTRRLPTGCSMPQDKMVAAICQGAAAARVCLC
jgi:hypothetical protein